MNTEKTGLGMKIFVTLSFIAMITLNALANIIPINGVNTGQVSDFYGNLFAPAGITFAIWGLIYLLLLAYTIYQWGGKNGTLLNKTGMLFSVSSLANAVWILTWHYKLIPLSMILITFILICLIMINRIITGTKLSTTEKIFVGLPFSVYFGWLTVAVIANATTLLVYLKWNGFGIPADIWAVVVILTGMIIGSATMFKNRDIAYGLVLVWAYAGILNKHLSPSGFAGQYKDVITTVSACLAVFACLIIYILISGRKKSQPE
jgi:hypothetical protein